VEISWLNHAQAIISSTFSAGSTVSVWEAFGKPVGSGFRISPAFRGESVILLQVTVSMLQSYFDSEDKRHRSFELPGSTPLQPGSPRTSRAYFLDLSLDIPNQSYHGTCAIQLRPIRSGIERLTLDAVNLNIQSVQIDNTQQRFDYDGEQLHIQLNSPSQVGKPVMIAIAYSVENPAWHLLHCPG